MAEEPDLGRTNQLSARSIIDAPVVSLLTGRVTADIDRPCAQRLCATEAGVERRLFDVKTPLLWLVEPEGSSQGLVLVIPGGSYEFVSVDNEGVGCAAYLNELGYTAAILLYRLPAEQERDRQLVTVGDAIEALKWLEAESARRSINRVPLELGIIGFSAGGHLALAAVSRRMQEGNTGWSWLALVYPVFRLSGPDAHEETALNLLGTDADATMLGGLDGTELLHGSVPPIFARHLANDPVVRAGNTVQLQEAIKRSGVESDVTVIPGDGHGVGLTPRIAADLARFLNRDWSAEGFASAHHQNKD